MNNFNQSSNGINISLNCFYDTFLSSVYFKESLKEFNSDLWLFTGGCISDFEPVFYPTKKELQSLFFGAGNDLVQWFNQGLRSGGRRFSQATKNDLLSFFQDNETKDDFFKIMLSLDCKKNFEIIEVTGYSQGDYGRVIVPHCLVKEFGQTKPKNYTEWATNYREELGHLFFDSPIRCTLEVNNFIYYLDEHINNIYEYDKKQAIDIFKPLLAKDFEGENLECIYSWLSVNLPVRPDYV